MIYYVYNENMQERLRLRSRVISRAVPYKTDSRVFNSAADFIFTIKDGKPVYIKNRFGDEDYFPEDDIAVMILSAMPM